MAVPRWLYLPAVQALHRAARCSACERRLQPQPKLTAVNPLSWSQRIAEDEQQSEHGRQEAEAAAG